MFGYNPQALGLNGRPLNAMGSPLNPGPGGPMNDTGPSTINVTDPSRYGTRPGLFGGGQMSFAAPQASPAPAQPAAGMFAGGAAPAKHKKIDFGQIASVVMSGLLGAEAARGIPGAQEQLQNMQANMMYARKKKDEDAQTAQYVQALVAQGMDPNAAVIMAADPAEMAKHIGTHYDAATVDEGSSRLLPNLNGTINSFTAPKTFQNKADVVQMPGQAGVIPPFNMMSADGTPQALGSPMPVPGLRPESEQYASSIGAQPGTPQWTSAIQDFTLHGNGPTAFGFHNQLQGARLSNARDIAMHRDATSAANNLRSTDASRYSADHRTGPHAAASRLPTPSTVVGGIMAKQASGQPLTPAEEGTLRDYRTHHKAQVGAVTISPNEPVATDAQGRKIVVRNGKWVPAN